MRFARAGSTVRESAAAFISGGDGTGEGGAGDGEIECSGVVPLKGLVPSVSTGAAKVSTGVARSWSGL